MTAASMNLTLAQAQRWLPGSVLHAAGDTVMARVHTDTRSLRAGDLFVALRGERFDGNTFLAQAREQGAVAALCSDAQALQASGLPGLVVPDARVALGTLAAAWRARFDLALIAVTGSNGKTTVTQMVAAILRAQDAGASLATEGNFNNAIGVPLTLLRLRGHHRRAVVELGMNHPGEIGVLAAWARPTVALVNNAQREHQEFMASVEAVARENGAVIGALPADGCAVFPAGDAYSALWHALAGARRTLTFALAGEAGADHADVVATQAEWAGEGWAVVAHTPAGTLRYTLRVAGRHNVRNSLAAIASALAAGVEADAIVRGLQGFEPVNGRSRATRLTLGGQALTLIDDTYNANPDSVRAAIDVLADLPGPRLLVLGDMGEVGEQGPAFHAEVGAYARERGIDRLYALGELARHAVLGAHARHFADVQALDEAVLASLPDFQSVLVKGSRFMRMERVVQAITAHAAHNRGTSHAA